MKLIARNLMTWTEPTLFPVRMRDRRGWVGKGLLAFVIFAVMSGAFALDRVKKGKGPKFSVPGGIALAAFIGVFLTAMTDAPSLNRQVTIAQDDISAFGNAGTVFSHASWRVRDVTKVRLIPPEALGRSFGAMEVWTGKGPSLLGVPRAVSLARVAEVLDGLGVRVELPGWSRGQAPAGPVGEAPPPSPTVVPVGSARVEALPEGEAGRIYSPGHRSVAVALALGPGLSAVIVGLVLLVVCLVRMKFFGAPLTRGLLAQGVGGMVGFMGGLGFLARYMNLLPSLYLRAVARSVIESRPDAAVDPRHPDAVFVDVIPRETWGKPRVNEASDMGFLRVDPLAHELTFEGDHERWRVPASSLISVGVETFLPHGAVEGPEADRRYVAVIKARVGDGVWEGSVVPPHLDLRPRDNARREALAGEVCERVRALLPAQRLTGQPAGRFS